MSIWSKLSALAAVAVRALSATPNAEACSYTPALDVATPDTDAAAPG